MVNAIVMINCSVDSIPEVAQQVADIEGVEEVYSVTGSVDLIALVRLGRYEELADIVSDRIAKIPGITSLATHLAFRTYSKSDLEEAFHLGLD
ncbi:Lrp/AsnC ligand binding domain-containing protein [Actinomycetaceae bacterium MB13-C1-2]|nr:Lrp/AsnC ligand binding domain-containing protein [Actinomycetaceae bacterium MB13-C1-2]